MNGSNFLGQALELTSIPPAPLLSSGLAQLGRLDYHLLELPCGDGRDLVTSKLLLQCPASRITGVYIYCTCLHYSPCLNEWLRLFSILNDAITANDFNSLQTIIVHLGCASSFEVDFVHAIVSSQSYSPKWTEMFTISSISFAPTDDNDTPTTSEQGAEDTEESAEVYAEGIHLLIGLGFWSTWISQTVTVVYTRRQCS